MYTLNAALLYRIACLWMTGPDTLVSRKAEIDGLLSRKGEISLNIVCTYYFGVRHSRAQGQKSNNPEQSNLALNSRSGCTDLQKPLLQCQFHHYAAYR